MDYVRFRRAKRCSAWWESAEAVASIPEADLPVAWFPQPPLITEPSRRTDGDR